MTDHVPAPTPLVSRTQNLSRPRPKPPEELLLNRYRVLARRGTGGFGTVCTCWDTRLQRRVAIKRMPLVSADPDGIPASTVDEVLREARTACLLAHPNIVSVLDFEHDDSYAYLIMEYVDGLNLAELLARVEGGRLTHEECSHILTSCARALAYAHENRVLHMDIKPTNIMIDRMGTVKVADLGMAELGAAAGYGGARGGTVGYMPPEQIEGMLVDERADVFSLAAVIWQALTGKNPFLAPTAGASLERIRRGPRLSSKGGETGLDLAAEDALVSALAPAASDRTSSVDELACALVGALGDESAGQASLAELIEQAESDDEAGDAAWGKRRFPFHLSLPQAWTVTERALPALAVASFAAVVLPALAQKDPRGALAVLAACCALAAVWPPSTTLTCGAAAVLAIATTEPASSSFVLAGSVGLALAAWWASVGRDEPMASVAVVVPWACGHPLAGAQMAGFCLDPAPALVTGGFTYLMGTVMAPVAAAGFSAGEAIAPALDALADPFTWFGAAAAALAAWISSLVAMRGTVASGIAGQAVGAALLVAGAWARARVENDGLWGSRETACCVVAVTCFLFMCILTVLRGPLFAGQKGEDTDEFSQ